MAKAGYKLPSPWKCSSGPACSTWLLALDNLRHLPFLPQLLGHLTSNLPLSLLIHFLRTLVLPLVSPLHLSIQLSAGHLHLDASPTLKLNAFKTELTVPTLQIHVLVLYSPFRWRHQFTQTPNTDCSLYYSSQGPVNYTVTSLLFTLFFISCHAFVHYWMFSVQLNKLIKLKLLDFFKPSY